MLRCIVFALIGLMLLGASEPPAPTQSAKGYQNSASGEKSESKRPPSPTGKGAPKTADDRIADYTFWVMAFTGGLAIVGGLQGFLIWRQIRLARDEFNATHRPRLSIRNIDVKSAGIDVLVWGDIRRPSPNEIFSGQFYVANKGDASARITDAYLCFWTSREGLPMSRPYEGENGNLGIISIWIEPGASVPILFSTPLIASDIGDATFVDAGQQTVFAMGWIEYIDQAGRIRRSAFCRPYVSRKRRFMRSEESDPDYEHEE